MFGSGKQHAIFHKAGGVADARDVSAAGFDFEIVEIGAAENDAGAGGGGEETEVRRDGGVEAYAVNVNGAIYGLLKFQDDLLVCILDAAAQCVKTLWNQILSEIHSSTVGATVVIIQHSTELLWHYGVQTSSQAERPRAPLGTLTAHLGQSAILLRLESSTRKF